MVCYFFIELCKNIKQNIKKHKEEGMKDAKEWLLQKTILYVDDDKINRELMKETLEGEGHLVFLAKSGEEAKKILAALIPDLVITDRHMGEISGEELLKWIKQQPHLKNVKTILTSTDPGNVPAGTVFMEKPWELNLLIDLVKILTES